MSEALAYMPIHRIYNVVQGFIPAGAECNKLIYHIRHSTLDVECSMFIFE